MVSVQAIARKWGNSLGVIIPKEVVEHERLSEDTPVVFEVRRMVDLRSLKGKHHFKKSTQAMKDEMREGWE